MKVKVRTKFKDKNTKKMYQVGEELTINEKRYEEIKRFVTLVETKETTKQKGESQK